MRARAGVAVNRKPLKIANRLIFYSWIHRCQEPQTDGKGVSLCGAMDSTPDFFWFDYSHVARSSPVRSSRFFSSFDIYIYIS